MNESVTHRGRLLSNFEGLLHSKYGEKSVCERNGSAPAVFVANGCSPLAKYSPYFYTFSHTPQGALRLSHRQPRDFGNYPRVILLGHDTVRCDTGKRPRYLVTYADAASFTVSCQAAQ
jgi:hypothetical protein